MQNTYFEEIEARGFATMPSVLALDDVALIIEQLEEVPLSDSTRQRGQSYFGIRNLLSTVPSLQNLARSASIRSLVDPIAGPGAKIVRGIFFDKTPQANCRVPCHHDLTMAVRGRKEVEGF